AAWPVTSTTATGTSAAWPVTSTAARPIAAARCPRPCAAGCIAAAARFAPPSRGLISRGRRTLSQLFAAGALEEHVDRVGTALQLLHRLRHQERFRIGLKDGVAISRTCLVFARGIYAQEFHWILVEPRHQAADLFQMFGWYSQNASCSLIAGKRD